jgi:hypothetical protein
MAKISSSSISLCCCNVLRPLTCAETALSTADSVQSPEKVRNIFLKGKLISRFFLCTRKEIFILFTRCVGAVAEPCQGKGCLFYDLAHGKCMRVM